MIQIRLPRFLKRKYYPAQFLGMEWEPRKMPLIADDLCWDFDKKFPFRELEACQKECDRRNRLPKRQEGRV